MFVNLSIFNVICGVLCEVDLYLALRTGNPKPSNDKCNQSM